MSVVVTGSKGFIGKNLCFFLREHGYKVDEIHRDTKNEEASKYLSRASFVFHLAGVNRTNNELKFEEGNIEFTKSVINTLSKYHNHIPILFSSSSQATNESLYGLSKLGAEKLIREYSNSTGTPCYIYRLPNVFGKWSKPHYNSFIATFCHNIINNKEIVIHDKLTEVKLVYIDDVCKSFINTMTSMPDGGNKVINQQYESTVGEVADILHKFKLSNETLITEKVGIGLVRALYSTYISFKDPSSFKYKITEHKDDRGVFCEMLKTQDSGQFSFFTALPGITRGGHYHHTKNEKFLVIKGRALFKFQNIATQDKHQLEVDGNCPEIVETIPGWSHDITNIGEDDLMVMLWANEIFDKDNPDTFEKKLYD